MDWRLKLIGQKVADVLLLGEFGRSVHQRLQSRLGKMARFGVELQDHEIRRGLQMAVFLRDKIETHARGMFAPLSLFLKKLYFGK